MAHATGCANFIWRECRHTESELIVKGGTMLQASRVPESMVVEEETQEQAWSGRSGVAGGARQRQASEPTPTWLRDPEWLYLPHLQQGQQEGKEEAEARGGEGEGASAGRLRRGVGGHLLRATGALVWCARCACHAIKRHGTGLKGACVVRRSDATQKRLQRLHAGRHPVTGKALG